MAKETITLTARKWEEVSKLTPGTCCRTLPAICSHVPEVSFSAFWKHRIESHTCGANISISILFSATEWLCRPFTFSRPQCMWPYMSGHCNTREREELRGRHISSHIMAKSPCFRYVSVRALLIDGFTLLKSSPVQQFLCHSMISHGPDYSRLTDYRSGC